MNKTLLISFYDGGYRYTIIELEDNNYKDVTYNSGSYEEIYFKSIEEILKEYPYYDKYIICEDGCVTILGGRNEK